MPDRPGHKGRRPRTCSARSRARAHKDHVTIAKLGSNKALTPVDLTELERMLAQSGVGTADETLGANQIEFVNLIVDHLTQHGMLDPGLLYESPFTDIAPHGPSGLFSQARVVELMAVLIRVRQSAAA